MAWLLANNNLHGKQNNLWLSGYVYVFVLVKTKMFMVKSLPITKLSMLFFRWEFYFTTSRIYIRNKKNKNVFSWFWRLFFAITSNLVLDYCAISLSLVYNVFAVQLRQQIHHINNRQALTGWLVAMQRIPSGSPNNNFLIAVCIF